VHAEQDISLEQELVDTVERVEELILRAQVFAHATAQKVRMLTASAPDAPEGASPGSTETDRPQPHRTLT
jgi:hypothetical protein